MAEVLAPTVTVTSTVDAPWAGEVAVMDPALLTVKLVAATLPNFTALAPVKLVPVMVTMVPPAVEPEAGLRPVTVGGGGGAPVEALRSMPRAEEVPAGDWVATGETDPVTLVS